ncbi:hypothetical protein BLOT_013336 [Blomia tropicalis]|nr:hypothetical protein BLOT_013336 [Blomia tropicalis]
MTCNANNIVHEILLLYNLKFLMNNHHQIYRKKQFRFTIKKFSKNNYNGSIVKVILQLGFGHNIYSHGNNMKESQPVKL